MNNYKIIMAFLLLFALNKAAGQQIVSAEIQVTGLTCSMCSQATEKSLRTLSYVKDVAPDLNKNVFVVSFNANAGVPFDQVQKKVTDAGFSVGRLSATLNFDQAKVDESGQLLLDGNVFRFENVKNKVLNGPVKVNVIDKNFISATAFKQKQAKFKLDSYASGTTQINGKKVRVYHLSI